jgi:hypothetical protein
MEFKVIQDVPSDLKDFYMEVITTKATGEFIISEGPEEGEIISTPITEEITTCVRIPLGESKAPSALDRVIALGKPLKVLEKFSETIATGYRVTYLEAYTKYLKDLETWMAIEIPEVTEEEEVFIKPDAPSKPQRYLPTGPEILAPYLREVAKVARTLKISKITVDIDGLIFDGDEDSQARMSRAIIIMDEVAEIPWTLADNTVVMVRRPILLKALKASGLIQAGLWSL